MARPKFALRYKFLFTMTALLVACLFLFLLVATQIIREDKTALIYELNKNNVQGIRSKVDTVFEGINDKLKTIAILNADGKNQAIENLVNNDSRLAGIQIEHPVLGATATITNGETQKTYPDQDIKSLLESNKTLSAKAKEKGEVFFRPNEKSPFIIYTKHLIVEDQSGQPKDQITLHTALLLSDILENQTVSSISSLAILSDDGEILFSSTQDSSFNKKFKVLYENAKNSVHSTGLQNLDVEGSELLTGFAKSKTIGLVTVSFVPSSIAFAAIYDLIRRALIVGGIILTIAFIVAMFFSRSLTYPLMILVRGMAKVSRGNLDTEIEVKSGDELQLLASSFNTMISDLKTSRMALETLNQDLEQKVLDRTSELERQNLLVREAQEALLKTSRLAAVGEIAGRAAHEVLNPLTTIVHRAENIEKSSSLTLLSESEVLQAISSSWDSDYQSGGIEKLVSEWKKPSSVNEKWNLLEEDIHNIIKIGKSLGQVREKISSDVHFLIGECQRITRIVEGMRSLSIVRANRRELLATPLLKEIKQIMTDVYKKNDVELTILEPEIDPKLNVDREEFIQSITNLLRNSLQSIQEAKKQDRTHKGLVTIAISTTDKIIMEITDNGIGIVPSDQSRLFKNQFTTKSPEEGTGLGLSISRRFLRAVNGDLEFVESIPYKKTTFRVLLPIPNDQVDQEVA